MIDIKPNRENPICPHLPTIVLASGSQRRADLLAMLRLRTRKVLPEFDESSVHAASARELVLLLSQSKGMAALSTPHDTNEPIITADTVVELDGQILGKPHDEAEARKMLSSLSGKTHEVHTGITVNYQGITRSAVETAQVDFRPISQDEIKNYIASGEPFDKAGGYGIQGAAGVFVRAVRGDYYTIVGLPLCRLYQLLTDELGIDLTPYYY